MTGAADNKSIQSSAPSIGLSIEQRSTINAKRLVLVPIVTRGANWFYWIAGLSLVNVLLAVANTNRLFVAGLLAPLVLSSDMAELEMNERIIILIIDAVFIALFAVLGYLANKRKTWAFLTGFALYLLDSFLLIAMPNLWNIVLHGIALFTIVNGYLKLVELNKLDFLLEVHDQVNS